jgi:hypothetical protein
MLLEFALLCDVGLECTSFVFPMAIQFNTFQNNHCSCDLRCQVVVHRPYCDPHLLVVPSVYDPFPPLERGQCFASIQQSKARVVECHLTFHY